MESERPGGQERRLHKRLRSSYLVKYQTGMSGGQPRVTNIKDLSAGGMKFLSSEILNESQTIRVTVLAPDAGEAFEADAQVLRVRRVKRNMVYSVAVHFQNIAEKDQTRLERFIEAVSQNQETSFCIDRADIVVGGRSK